MSDPSFNIIDRESVHLLLSFCTFCALIEDKHISIQNVFLLILQNPKLRSIFKELLNIDSDIEMVKCFLSYEPSLTTSKYITKFLNANRKSPIK